MPLSVTIAMRSYDQMTTKKTKEKKPKKPKPPKNARQYEREANRIARAWVIIEKCKDCKHPHVQGFVCDFCESADPEHAR